MSEWACTGNYDTQLRPARTEPGRQAMAFNSGVGRRRFRSGGEASELANWWQEMHLPCVQQRTDRAGFWHGKQRDRATHRRDAIEGQPFARHLGRLLSILPHHFRAVGGHRTSRHFDHRRAGGTDKRRLLTKQASQRANKHKQREKSGHGQLSLLAASNLFNMICCQSETAVSSGNARLAETCQAEGAAS